MAQYSCLKLNFVSIGYTSSRYEFNHLKSVFFLEIFIILCYLLVLFEYLIAKKKTQTIDPF